MRWAAVGRLNVSRDSPKRALPAWATEPARPALCCVTKAAPNESRELQPLASFPAPVTIQRLVLLAICYVARFSCLI